MGVIHGSTNLFNGWVDQIKVYCCYLDWSMWSGDTAVIEKLRGVLLFLWLLLLLCLSLKLWPESVIRWLMHYTDTGGWPLSQVTHVRSGALHRANWAESEWGPSLSSCGTWWPSVHPGCTGNSHMYTRGLHYNLYFTTTRRAQRKTEIKFIVWIYCLYLVYGIIQTLYNKFLSLVSSLYKSPHRSQYQ